MQKPLFQAIGPGQIRLAEHRSGRPLAACDRDALTAANVVLYPRTLAPLVASLLPVGAYAEPASETGLSSRAVDFAGEGWSVVQLVEPGPDFGDRLRRFSHGLDELARIGDLPVQIVVKSAMGRNRELDASVRSAGALLGEVARKGLLTLVFGPLPLRFSAPGPAYVFTANGLAG